MIDYIAGGWKWAIICSIIFVGVCCCLLNLLVKPYPEKLGFKIYEDEHSNYNITNRGGNEQFLLNSTL